MQFAKLFRKRTTLNHAQVLEHIRQTLSRQACLQPVLTIQRVIGGVIHCDNSGHSKLRKSICHEVQHCSDVVKLNYWKLLLRETKNKFLISHFCSDNAVEGATMKIRAPHFFFFGIKIVLPGKSCGLYRQNQSNHTRIHCPTTKIAQRRAPIHRIGLQRGSIVSQLRLS